MILYFNVPDDAERCDANHFFSASEKLIGPDGGTQQSRWHDAAETGIMHVIVSVAGHPFGVTQLMGRIQINYSQRNSHGRGAYRSCFGVIIAIPKAVGALAGSKTRASK